MRRREEKGTGGKAGRESAMGTQTMRQRHHEIAVKDVNDVFVKVLAASQRAT